MAKSREDWARAALLAIAEGGLAAVRVEALAPAVGASKGSFYWHFADRAALVDAALELWAEEATEDVIAGLDAIEAPRERLSALFSTAFRHPWSGRVDAALAAHADHPQVAPVLQRVTERRLGFLDDVYGELGCSPAEARRRSLVAYTSYLGLFAVRRAAPASLPAELDAYLDELLGMLEPR